MALIRAGVHMIWDSGTEISLYTFNPRHKRVYQRLLNMRTVASSAGTQGLSNAPAVFMRLDTPDIPARWREGYVQGLYLQAAQCVGGV